MRKGRDKVLDYLNKRSMNVEGMLIVKMSRRKIAKTLKLPQSSTYCIIKELIHSGDLKKYDSRNNISYYRIIDSETIS